MFRFKDGKVYVAGFASLLLTAPEVVKLDIEKNGDKITITAQNAFADESYSATLERSESGFKIADIGDGAMSGLSGLFRDKSSSVDVLFGGEVAFRV